MSNEKMREEFELAVLNSELLPCNSIVKIEGCDDYSSVLTGLAWLSWQTSRAALCVELPLAFSDERATTYLTSVTNALDAAGVRYKRPPSHPPKPVAVTMQRKPKSRSEKTLGAHWKQCKSLMS